MRPCWILIFTVVVRRRLIAQQAKDPQRLQWVAFVNLTQFMINQHLRIATMAQRQANRNGSRVMELYQSFVWYCVIAAARRRTRLSQSFGRMPKTLWSRTPHSGRLAGNSRCRPVLNSEARRKMTRWQRSARAAHDRPVSIWSSSGSHPEWTWRPPQQWQTATEFINQFQLLSIGWKRHSAFFGGNCNIIYQYEGYLIIKPRVAWMCERSQCCNRLRVSNDTKCHW